MKINIQEDTESMKAVFHLAIAEIESVLQRKKSITDVTRLAANTLSNYSRIKSSEIHNKAIELMIVRKDIKQLPEIK